MRAGVREPDRRPGSISLFSRLKVRARKPSSLALRTGEREPRRRPGSISLFSRHKVRARKPNSLALRATVREPCRRPGSISPFSRLKVRVRKPSSLALRASEREPCRRLGSIFLFSRHRVRARKPNSLALRATVREPCRRPGSISPFPGSKFALKNRIHWLCGQASANPVPHAGARASGRTLTHKKRKAAISKSKSLLPLFWGLIDRILFLYGFIRYETPAAMLSSCEGSLPGLHMRTGTALPFP